MSILSPTGLAYLRRAFRRLLVDTFTVQAATLTSNGSGGQTQSWTDETTGVAGFLKVSRYRSDESLSGAHQQEQRKWTVVLERGTVVDASKRIKQTHKDGIAISVRYFQIESVIAGDSLDMEVTCECVETPNVI